MKKTTKKQTQQLTQEEIKKVYAGLQDICTVFCYVCNPGSDSCIKPNL